MICILVSVINKSTFYLQVSTHSS